MKFSELKQNIKEELYYSYEFDNFRDRLVEKELLESDFPTFIKNKFGITIQIDEAYNIHFLSEHIPYEKETIIDLLNDKISELNEEYSYYSEELDVLLDEYCTKENLFFDEDGNYLSKDIITVTP